MKRLFYSVMAIVMSLSAASCSQEEILGNDGGEKVATISVNLPQSNTRAMPTVPEGYKLRCIMQVVDDKGAAIADEDPTKPNFRQVKLAEDKMVFTFMRPKDVTDYKVTFWADYVKENVADADLGTKNNIYKPLYLPKVSYATLTDKQVFNTAAADAFYGCIAAGVPSVELKRPFARLNIKPSATLAPDYAGFDRIKIVMNVPTNFNLVDGTVGTGDQTLTYEGPIADAEKNIWFSTYVFVGNNKEDLGEGKDILLTFSKQSEPAVTKELTIHGTAVKLTDLANKWVNVNVDDADQVEITFPGDMEEPGTGETPEPTPDPVELKLGQYVYADGTVGTDATNAVAIVFKVGAGDGDDIANYTGVDGKEIAGYAFAIRPTNRAYLANFTGKPADVPVADDNDNDGTKLKSALNGSVAGSTIAGTSVYGPVASKQFMTAFDNYKFKNESPLMKDYIARFGASGTSVITGDVSAWYIPSALQMRDILGSMFTGETTGWTLEEKVITYKKENYPTQVKAIYDAYNAIAGNESNADFKNLNFGWGNNTTGNLLVGELISDNGLAGGKVNTKNGATTYGTTVTDNAAGQYSFRPVVTLFKDAASN